MFLFGDAFLDTGNNNYIGNTPTRADVFPYGISFFSSPTGRFSDCRLIPDFLAKHSNLSFISPFLQPGNDEQFQDGVNFASGGSVALTQTFQGEVIDLSMQLDNYRKFQQLQRDIIGDYGTLKRFSEAVYLFSVRTNDYGYLFLTNSTYLTAYRKSDFVDMVISNITNVVLVSTLPTEAAYDTDNRVSWTKQLHAPLEVVDPEIADIIEHENPRQ